MKLLYCRNCGDVFSLKRCEPSEARRCTCGGTSGYYVDDLNAVYSGQQAIPLGFDNPDFLRAVGSAGRTAKVFIAFVMPDPATTFIRLDDDPGPSKEG
jgi:hypothetical protein